VADLTLVGQTTDSAKEEQMVIRKKVEGEIDYNDGEFAERPALVKKMKPSF